MIDLETITFSNQIPFCLDDEFYKRVFLKGETITFASQ